MAGKVQKFIDEAEEFTDGWQVTRWQARVSTFLEHVYGLDRRQEFEGLTRYVDNSFDQLAKQLGYLEAIVQNDTSDDVGPQEAVLSKRKTIPLGNKRVFVVHGHDNEAKQTACRFIEKLGLQAVVLHERPNEGKTVVEKFEQNADVAFAVVLLTPDDKGAPASDPSSVRFRARQNVVLELGYFLASLGRNRVCALHKGDIEIPSDYQGVLYVEMDNGGAWRNKLAQELISAHIEIDLTALTQ